VGGFGCRWGGLGFWVLCFFGCPNLDSGWGFGSLSNTTVIVDNPKGCLARHLLFAVFLMGDRRGACDTTFANAGKKGQRGI